MNSEFHDVESIEQKVDKVIVENSISPTSDIASEMIGPNKFDILESNRISQNRSSFASLDVMDISVDLKSNCDNNLSNQLFCINSQSLQTRITDDSDFDEQRRRIECSNLVNDDTNTAKTDDERENLDIIDVDLDENKLSDFSLNDRTIHADEQSECEIESNEAITKTIATVQSKKVNCDEKPLNEKFDADFSQFASFQKNSSVLSTNTVTLDPIESVQNCEISNTSVLAEGTTHAVSNENAFIIEDDEFGDFSSFSPPTIAGKNSVQLISFRYYHSLDFYYYYLRNERSMFFFERTMSVRIQKNLNLLSHNKGF